MLPVWIENGESAYAEFCAVFHSETCRKTVLKISADYKFAAYINGAFVANGLCADLPCHKGVASVDVTEFLIKGENRLIILAEHTFEDYSVARSMPAFIAFSVEEGENVLAFSSENTLARPAKGYRAGDLITPQLGLGWSYDFTSQPAAWENARLVDTEITFEPRSIPLMNMQPRCASSIVAQGVYKYREGATAAEKMQNSWLATLPFAAMTGKGRAEFADLSSPLRFSATGGDGIFVVVDLLKEVSGYLSLSLKTTRACRAFLGWGEHLSDLRVRTKIANRNFASALYLAAGENKLSDDLHRIGCRYLALYVEADAFEVEYIGIRESLYPFKEIKKDFGDRLLNKIYEISRRTLQLCAHEHYEDCPWREQALYGMDSRNQMLFGYSAFQEYELPRASIRLFAYSAEEDGLIPLCAPARNSITIPVFSIFWMLALCENAREDYDECFVKEMLPYAEKMLKTFEARTTEEGVSCFTEPHYWNFYEWTDGLDGGEIFRKEPISATSDGILTALALLAAKRISELENRAGNAAYAEKLSEYAENLRKCLEGFYDGQKGLYASFIAEGKRTGWHEYTQAAMILTDCVERDRALRLSELLKQSSGELVKISFAALSLKYDAIIQTDGDIDFCVNEICDIYGKMLFSGATSFWETEKGEADFGNAGSMCHGWSAVACYVFDRYLK